MILSLLSSTFNVAEPEEPGPDGAGQGGEIDTDRDAMTPRGLARRLQLNQLTFTV